LYHTHGVYFQELDLPISRQGSCSQSTTSTTTSSPQSPTTYMPTVPSDATSTLYNGSHHTNSNVNHLHLVHYYPSSHTHTHHKLLSPHTDKSIDSKDSYESPEEVWVKQDEPTPGGPHTGHKSDQGLLDTDNVELKDYSYVMFQRQQQHEYSYPNLEPIHKPPSKREASNKKHSQISEQPKPPLPLKTKKKDKHKNLQTGRLLSKARCKYCHEMFSYEDNQRGSCDEAPDSVQKCIEIITCVCCAKCLIYHCMSDADGEYGHPCICDSSDESNCRKWTVLSVLSLFVPCLWCYWPLKACHMCGVSCGCCGGRHKAV